MIRIIILPGGAYRPPGPPGPRASGPEDGTGRDNEYRAGPAPRSGSHHSVPSRPPDRNGPEAESRGVREGLGESGVPTGAPPGG